MARITFSPIIVEASGKVGDAVFSRWKGIPYIRSRVTPSNPQTAAQTAQREALANALTMWQSIKSWSKAVWDTYATGYALSGYNRYMDVNILKIKAPVAGVLTPANADFIKISAEAAAAGASGIITCTWTNDTGSDVTDKIYAFYRKSEVGSEAYAWEDGGNAVPTDETLSVSGLTPGHEYEVAFACMLTDKSIAQEGYNEILDCGA